jgi:integrase
LTERVELYWRGQLDWRTVRRPADPVQTTVAATSGERDRLLLRTLWATGARLGAVLALRPRDVRRTGLLLRDPTDPRGPGKLAPLAKAHASLPTELRRWARAHALTDDEPLFFSRERGQDGRRKAIDRVRAWQIVTLAARRASGAEQNPGQPRAASNEPNTRARREPSSAPRRSAAPTAPSPSWSSWRSCVSRTAMHQVCWGRLHGR